MIPIGVTFALNFIPLVSRYVLLKLIAVAAFGAFLQNSADAQQSTTLLVQDATDAGSLPGVVINIPALNIIAATDENGALVISNPAAGNYQVRCSMIAYEALDTIISFPTADDTVVLSMKSTLEALDVVHVTSTRTNARIEDAPTRIEVLGIEEMGEESTLVPTAIGSILGDLAIITIQRTDITTGNDEVRMAGLDPRYTQLLRDGLPLYSGASGGLGALDIPPLDLQQVEVIKGSNSTLYGGGAIAGLINFVSRKPTKEFVFDGILNLTSHLGSHGSIFTGKDYGKFGYTCFAATSLNQPVAIQSDDFSIIPQEQQYIIHPRLFYAIDTKTKIDAGFQWNHDRIDAGYIGNGYQLKDGDYHAHNLADRLVQDLTISHEWSAHNSIAFKSAVSTFSRTQELETSDISATTYFTIRQTNAYMEFSDVLQLSKHTIVMGYNFLFENFDPQAGELQLSNRSNDTHGLFVQDDWILHPKLTCEIGLRADVQSVYGAAILPRLALFYKPAKEWSIRLSGGTGYKTPDALDLSEPVHQLTDPSVSLSLEHSGGVNADINFRSLINDRISLECNQAFYLININHPYALDVSDSTAYTIINEDAPITSIGSDTYIRLEIDEFECYLGYNHTIAEKRTSDAEYLPYFPHDKISGVIAYDNETWRMGVEAAYQANQFLPDQQETPDYLFMAAMISRSFGHFRLTLNGENLTNTLQQQLTNHPIVSGNPMDPQFSDIWAPVEGTTINLSLKYTF